MEWIIAGEGERDLYYGKRTIDDFLGTFPDEALIELRDLLNQLFPSSSQTNLSADSSNDLFLKLQHQAQRERISTSVLSGFASIPAVSSSGSYMANYAIEWADALIAKLNKD